MKSIVIGLLVVVGLLSVFAIAGGDDPKEMAAREEAAEFCMKEYKTVPGTNEHTVCVNRDFHKFMD